MSSRRTFLLLAGASALAACQVSSGAQQVVVDRDDSTAAQMRVSEVLVELNPGMGRPFLYAGLAPDQVHQRLADQVQAALNGANPSGTRPTRAVIKLSAIVIADRNSTRATNYDSVINAEATFIDIETGTQLGAPVLLGLQATYRPRFFGGRDRAGTPEQELELITQHSAAVLAERIFG